ncbi:hypothetical protein ACLESD_09470 [Pyxidicoccus sp. 3LFB2]
MEAGEQHGLHRYAAPSTRRATASSITDSDLKALLEETLAFLLAQLQFQKDVLEE